MTYLLSIQLVVAVIQIYLVWRLLAAFEVLRRFDERLGHFGAALTLLTETAETGFVTMGQELERQGVSGAARRAQTPPPAKAAATRAPDLPAAIAEPEEMAPSEMRVRLHLADKAARNRGAARLRQERH